MALASFVTSTITTITNKTVEELCHTVVLTLTMCHLAGIEKPRMPACESRLLNQTIRNAMVLASLFTITITTTIFVIVTPSIYQ